MTKQDEQELVRLLKLLEPGFLPYDIFEQLARLVVLPIIEFVPLRLHAGKVQVLLLSRGPDDPIFPNELHTPGTVIRSTDTEKNMYLAFHRILHDELADTKVSDPYYVGSNLHKSKRGMEQAQVFWVEVLGKSAAGEWYDVDSLPPRAMKSQLNFIRQATKSFQDAGGRATAVE